MEQTTKNSKTINAPVDVVYKAFTNARALEKWQAPEGMAAKVHYFEFKSGGGYEMSLYYPDRESEMKGKTTEKEDRYRTRFIELIPNKKIVQAINFESSDPAFSGEMFMEITFTPTENGTIVAYFFKNIPIGIKPEDNEAGTISTLEKLASYVEGNY
jgi:uncharacterized protein YndB with AHSA1/START domain